MSGEPHAAPSALEQTLGRLVAAGVGHADDLAASLGLEPHQLGRPLRKLTLAGLLDRQPLGSLALTPAGRTWLKIGPTSPAAEPHQQRTNQVAAPHRFVQLLDAADAGLRADAELEHVEPPIRATRSNRPLTDADAKQAPSPPRSTPPPVTAARDAGNTLFPATDHIAPGVAGDTLPRAAGHPLSQAAGQTASEAAGQAKLHAAADDTSQAARDVAPRVARDAAHRVAVETSPQAAVDMSLRAPGDTSPGVAGHAAAQTAIDTSPQAAIDTSPQAAIDTSPRVAVDTSPSVAGDVAARVAVDTSLQAIGHQAARVAVATSPQAAAHVAARVAGDTPRRGAGVAVLGRRLRLPQVPRVLRGVRTALPMLRLALRRARLTLPRVHVPLPAVRLRLPRVRLAFSRLPFAFPRVRLALDGVEVSASAGRRMAALAAMVIGLMIGVQLGLPAWGVATLMPMVGARSAHDAPVALDTAPATPTNPAAVVAQAPTPAPAPAGPAEQWLVVAHTDGLGLVLRAAPASTVRVLTLQEGARVRATGDSVQQAGRAWLPVASQTGKTGWVAREFVAPQP